MQFATNWKTYMVETQTDENIPVPRQRVKVLADGTFIVQWEATNVQTLVDGRYIASVNESEASAITDYELRQLVQSNIIKDFNADYVFLSLDRSVAPQTTRRSFYLNCKRKRGDAVLVEDWLVSAGLNNHYAVRVQERFVIIRGKNGTAFSTYIEADRARQRLVNALPQLDGTLIAFVEFFAV